MADQSAAIGPDRVIDILARACEDVSDLAIHLEQTLQNLREVDDHLSRARTAGPLAREARVVPAWRGVAEGEPGKSGNTDRLTSPLAEIQALLDRANTRAVAIMAALERKVLPSALSLQR
jgi:hypothetical protein